MSVEVEFKLQPSLPFGGWLEKKGSLRKNWKLRYFYLANGVLKYYGKGPSSAESGNYSEGGDIKGDVSLVGAEISVFEGTQIHLTLNGEKKTIFYLRAKTNKEANEWHAMLTKQVQYQNILALQNGSRSPEIVEWYYQYQGEVNRRCGFLLKSIEVYIHFPNSGNVNTGPTISAFNIAMNEERTGLVLALQGQGKKYNRMESINNGRILLFADILGAKLLSGGWILSPENHFHFVLITSEDELTLEMDSAGVSWLQAVQEIVLLSKIPKPSARSVSVSPPGRVMSSTINSLIEFSSNSGAVFTCSNDVQLLLEGFSRVTTKSPVIAEISSRLNTILKLIPELKYNKETGFIFGERVEEIIRILGDTENGILYVSRENDKSLLNFHLSTLNNKLSDIMQYFVIQCKPGWLISNITSRNQENMRMKLDHYDYELISIVNILIKALGLNPNLLMDRKEYNMAVDIRKSIEALGGIEAIYHDVAKERALARLIQSDAGDVHDELVEYIKQAQNGFDINTSAGARKSREGRNSRISLDVGSSRGTNREKRSCWSYFFCCCYSKKRTDSNDSKYQLYDEKNVITVSSTTNPIQYNSRRNSERNSKLRMNKLSNSTTNK